MQPLRHGGLSGLCRVTEHLYLSNIRAASDASLIRNNLITCIISATETRPGSPAPFPGVEYLHIPVTDTPEADLWEHFDPVADRIQRVAEEGGRTLVHCCAGVSRSASLCLAYLMKHWGETLLEAHRTMKAARPMARPNSGFWSQLVRYEEELRGCNSVHMVSSPMGQIPHIYEAEARNMTPL